MALLCAMALPGTNAAPVALPTGEYDITLQTVLPHLEEALRYATTHARLCLVAPDATGIFPLLRHQASTGCSLVPSAEGSDGLRFDLQCANREAATGSAVFAVDAGQVSGVLEVKMGGKNMTLSQRFQGRRTGPCAENAPR